MALEINQTTPIKCINPATRAELGEIATTPVDQIHEIVRQAHTAQEAWGKLPLAKRLEYVEQFRQLLYKNREELAKLVTSETGKPLSEALVAEVFGVLETCKWLRNKAASVLSPESVQINSIFLPGKRVYNVYEPMGVIAVISPWNYPFSIPVSSILASVVTGNAVVWKPSPKTALIAQYTWDLLRRAGFPQGLIGLIQGDRIEAETLILSDVQRVMFTGSTGGGKAIMALAARKLLPVTLELGGKHAAIVLDDSDPAVIARPLVWAAFTNAGQACASIERLYVSRSMKEKLVPLIAEQARNLRLGNGLSDTTDVGPLIDEQSAVRIQQQVQRSVDMGAKLLAGGATRFDLGGYFFEPAVLSDVTHEMPVISEEIFGPVLPIVEVSNEEEAIKLANESNLGLGASIWTVDTDRAERLARRIHAGMVWVNDGLYTHVSPDAPWGGIKESGFGRMHSAAELRDLVYTKNIGVNKQQQQIWNFPYSGAALDYIRGGLELIHGAATTKLSALGKIGSAMRRMKR